MTEASDADLLRRYAAEASEPAFGELVRRHVDLVYSAALRQTAGNHHWAQEVTQMVFTTLARKAGSLLRHPALPAWLYRTTAFTVAMSRRTAARRAAYEQRAAAEILSASAGTSNSAGSDVNWTEVRPVLDAAMGELPERDREAIILRYFTNAPLANVGRRLGLSENAARMRVDRALDKLRLRLSKHGVTSAGTAAALAATLSAQAVSAAPLGLAISASGAAVAAISAAAAGGGLAAVMPFMTATKISLGVWTLAVVAGVATLVQQQRAATRLEAAIALDQAQLNSLAELQNENLRLLQAVKDARQIKANADSLAQLQSKYADLKQALSKRTLLSRPVMPAAPSEALGKVYPASQLDVQPAVTRQGHPVYPPEMRENGRGGTVVVDFVVDASGTVKNAYAASSTESAFEASAVAGVSQWQYTAGQVGGTAVAAHLQVPIVYSLGTAKKTGPNEFLPTDWFSPSDGP